MSFFSWLISTSGRCLGQEGQLSWQIEQASRRNSLIYISLFFIQPNPALDSTTQAGALRNHFFAVSANGGQLTGQLHQGAASADHRGPVPEIRLLEKVIKAPGRPLNATGPDETVAINRQQPKGHGTLSIVAMPVKTGQKYRNLQVLLAQVGKEILHFLILRP